MVLSGLLDAWLLGSSPSPQVFRVLGRRAERQSHGLACRRWQAEPARQRWRGRPCSATVPEPEIPTWRKTEDLTLEQAAPCAGSPGPPEGASPGAGGLCQCYGNCSWHFPRVRRGA